MLCSGLVFPSHPFYPPSFRDKVQSNLLATSRRLAAIHLRHHLRADWAVIHLIHRPVRDPVREAVDLRSIHLRAVHLHRSVHPTAHSVLHVGGHGTDARRVSRGVISFAHAVHVGPEALSYPAYLAEDLLAARHFFFAVARGGDVGELVDEGAARVDELAEGGGRPVGDQGLVEGDDVAVCAGGGERAEGRGILPGCTVALDANQVSHGESEARDQGTWWRLTCSVPHSTTMPSRSEALVLLALTNRSSSARVMGVGGSWLRLRPYFVAVISKKDISRRMLFRAEISRSMVRYMGWNCELAVCGRRNLASSCPTKRMKPRA